jgi:hypothetical protein
MFGNCPPVDRNDEIRDNLGHRRVFFTNEVLT